MRVNKLNERKPTLTPGMYFGKQNTKTILKGLLLLLILSDECGLSRSRSCVLGFMVMRSQK
jgi:hypothetical protein